MSDSSKRDYTVEPTIVGGRPLGNGRPQHGIPRGIEVLVKKASVDSVFRELLLEKRSAAASEIDLELSAAEIAILNSLPRPHFEQIITNTTVPDEHRRVFLGKIAAAMLAVLTLPLSASAWEFDMGGIRPDQPKPVRKRPVNIVRLPPEHERFNVEIVDHGKDSVTIKCSYECPFDLAELRVVFGRDRETSAATLTCRPDRTVASKGSGEAEFSVKGTGGTTNGLLLRLHRSTDQCEEVARNHLTLAELERALPDSRPGEYVMEDCVIYKVVEFRKIWPS